MARQLWIADAARASGLKVQEVEGWKTRGSDVFTPRGVILHHTAGPAKGNMPSLGIITNGRSDLPGPLSQFGLGRDGTVYVVAAGRANHAGQGTWRGASGNGMFFGIEAENTGVGEPWGAAQLDAYLRLATALCKHMGVTADMVAGHKEYATPKGRKPDPRGIDCDWFRNAVRAGLSGTAARSDEEDNTMYLIQHSGAGGGIALFYGGRSVGLSLETVFALQRLGVPGPKELDKADWDRLWGLSDYSVVTLTNRVAELENLIKGLKAPAPQTVTHKLSIEAKVIE